LLSTVDFAVSVEGLRLFKFTAAFQTKLEGLLAKNELSALSTEESNELDGLKELERFFTYLNARLQKYDIEHLLRQ
jgi:hypothetical protein